MLVTNSKDLDTRVLHMANCVQQCLKISLSFTLLFLYLTTLHLSSALYSMMITFEIISKAFSTQMMLRWICTFTVIHHTCRVEKIIFILNSLVRIWCHALLYGLWYSPLAACNTCLQGWLAVVFLLTDFFLLFFFSFNT